MSIRKNACLYGLLKEEVPLKAYSFLKDVLKYCENKPEIVVDKGPWYFWALKRLRLNYRHETFGKRNAVEFFFSQLKK